jgi:dephospho-CoA kinase
MKHKFLKRSSKSPMTNRIIVGITGTLGAGKGTVSHMLVKQGFAYQSVRNYLVQLLQKEQQEINRDTMHELANRLRKNFGSDYIVTQILHDRLIQKDSVDEPLIIESIRSIGEVKKLKSYGGILLAIDAPIQTRYSRILTRGSETDKVSFEKFMSDELSEQNNTEHEQNLQGCILLADYVIINDGDMTNLDKQVSDFLNFIHIFQK